MNRRILVPVSNPLGGIRTYMLYNFKPLHEKGFRFTFLSGEGGAFESFKRDVGDWAGTEFVAAPAGSGSRGMFQTLRKTLRAGSFDLVHSQGLKAGTIVSAADYFRHTPHLVTLHDVIVPENDIPGRFKGLKRSIISFFTRHASVLIPVTDDCRENHLELFPAWRKGPARIETIVNGVDVETLLAARKSLPPDERSDLRERLGIEPDAVLAGFFGRFMPQKGFDLVLEALAILVRRGYGDRFRLAATKDLNGYLNETIRDASKNPAVARMVRFIDPVSEIAPLLCRTDLLVMPSRWEACGLLAMEAMVLGVPVIGSDCIGLREVLAGTPSFAPKHGDPKALADALIEWIERPTTRAAEAYAPAATDRFDVRHATAKLLELYRQWGDRVRR